jgi:hypothetical protein
MWASEGALGNEITDNDRLLNQGYLASSNQETKSRLVTSSGRHEISQLSQFYSLIPGPLFFKDEANYRISIEGGAETGTNVDG